MSNKGKFGERKLKFDPRTKNSGLSNGLDSGKKNVPKLVPSRSSELGSPWGVLLKPIPHMRREKSKQSEEKLEAKNAIPKVGFSTGPHKVEQSRVKKSVLKNVNVVKTKKEVRLVITFSYRKGLK